MNIIEYVIKNKKITQLALAKKLNVSTAQISKWKAGHHMANDRVEELLAFCGLFGNDFQYAALVGTEEKSQELIAYFDKLNKINANCHEVFKDEPDNYTNRIICFLDQYGILIPKSIPDLDSSHPFIKMLERFIYSLGNIYHWMDFAFPSFEETYSENYRTHDIRYELEHEGVFLKILLEIFTTHEDCKKLNMLQQCNVDLVKYSKAESDYIHFMLKGVTEICLELNRKNIPIRHNYFDLIHKCSEELAEDTDFYHDEALVTIENYHSFAEKQILQKLNGIEYQLKRLRGIEL